MMSINKQIEALRESVKNIEKIIYQENGLNLMPSVNQFINDFANLVQSIEFLSEPQNVEIINNLLLILEDAIKNEDYVSINDVLNYEFLPLFDDIITLSEGITK